jgi:hypothetical protein
MNSWSRFWPCRKESLNKKKLKEEKQRAERKRSCNVANHFLFVSCTLYDYIYISTFLFYIWYVWNHKDKATLTFLKREACTSSENLILQWLLLLQHTRYRQQKIVFFAGWSSYLFKETNTETQTERKRKGVKSKKFGFCIIEKRECKINRNCNW